MKTENVNKLAHALELVQIVLRQEPCNCMEDCEGDIPCCPSLPLYGVVEELRASIRKAGK